MPFKSEAQNRWAHTPAGTKALGGPAAVKEWESATDYSHLPARKGYAQGGKVKRVDQEVGDNIPKGELFHHEGMAGGGGNPKKGIGGHNDGHGIYAQGGPVRNEGVDKHYKKPPPARNERGHYTTNSIFEGKTDRFTGGRVPVDYPREAETEESWPKPSEVGHGEDDDFGDCKTLKPVLPHASAGNHWYGKGNRDTTTDTFHESHEPKQD